MRGAEHLSHLNVQFADVVRQVDAFLGYFGLELRIVSGYRSGAEQAALYAKGRTPAEIANHVAKQGRDGSVTDAPPGTSAHNYGLAIDLDTDYPHHAIVMQVCRIIGFGTVSWDPAHLEWPSWRRVVA